MKLCTSSLSLALLGCSSIASQTSFVTAQEINVLCKSASYEFNGGTEAENFMGHSVSITDDGSLIASGEPGHNNGQGRVGLLSRDDTSSASPSSWSSHWITGPSPLAKFGYHTSLSGNGKWLAVGAPLDQGTTNLMTGSVTLYQVDSNFGLPFQKLTGERTRVSVWDWFGFKTALSHSGDVLVTTAPFSFSETLDGVGAMEVYRRAGDEDEDYDDFQLLGVVYGESQGENLGYDVALSDDGSMLVASSPYAETSDLTYYEGKVSIYEINANALLKIQTIWGEGSTQLLGFKGLALSKSASRLAINSHGFGRFKGQVTFYELDDSTTSTETKQYTQIGDTLEGSNSGDWFGSSIDFANDGNRVVISAQQGANEKMGAVYMYDFNTVTKNYELGSNNTYAGESKKDHFGGSIAIAEDSSTLVVGAEDADMNSHKSNGKAYVYEASCSTPCHDSPLRMRQGSNLKNCDWVRNNTNRCEHLTVRSHCPVTCAVPNCSLDSTKKFKLQGQNRGNKKTRTCNWVKKRPGKRCGMEGVAKTCRKTCTNHLLR